MVVMVDSVTRHTAVLTTDTWISIKINICPRQRAEVGNLVLVHAITAISELNGRCTNIVLIKVLHLNQIKCTSAHMAGYILAGWLSEIVNVQFRVPVSNPEFQWLHLKLLRRIAFQKTQETFYFYKNR